VEADYDDGCAKTRDFELTPRVYSKIDSRCGELGGLEEKWISPGLLPTPNFVKRDLTVEKGSSEFYGEIFSK
jgi:hypothetical protein